MRGLLVGLLLCLTGCTSFVDGWYAATPETVHRVEGETIQWMTSSRWLLNQKLPGRFEMSTRCGYRLPITCEQYDGVVRWGKTMIEIKDNKGVIQSPQDEWNWGEYSVSEMFN